MVLSEMLAATIEADRRRETERRNRDWRLRHPEPDEVSTAAAIPTGALEIAQSPAVPARRGAVSRESVPKAV